MPSNFLSAESLSGKQEKKNHLIFVCKIDQLKLHCNIVR